MTMEPLAIELTDLTDDEARQIWRKQTKLAGNFNKFVMALNARDVGASFNLEIAKICGPDKTDEYAREVKHNFNEAAKKRTKWVAIPDEDSAPEDAVSEPAQNAQGIWGVEVPAPVMLRWKAIQHTEKRTVQDGKAKKEIEVKVIDKLTVLIVATDSVKKRGPRAAASEQVDALVAALNPPTDAKTATLADGRTATKTKAGHWRAPKLAAVSGESLTLPSTDASSSNESVDGNSIRTNGQTVETPVGAA